jgi:uncharacterized protein YuzE
MLIFQSAHDIADCSNFDQNIEIDVRKTGQIGSIENFLGSLGVSIVQTEEE